MLIQVAVAVIINNNDEIFICRRSADQHQGNKWEFPGGKIEENEKVEDALRREIKEECGIDVQSQAHLIDITHEYETKTVKLEVFEIRNWSGEPSGMEGQPTRWIKRSELTEVEFPKANKAIVELLIK